MRERTTRTALEFRRQFHLSGMDGAQPSGIYDVETVEEQLDSVSIVAYRRVSTTILRRGLASSSMSRQLTLIDPVDLAAALEKDADNGHGRA